ncbi:MAG: addiction module protein [Planctomycetia bacterium]|nr:addiction module protein [Planctomycetia bacterium]
MNPQVSHLLAEALRLSPDDRVLLVEHLLETLPAQMAEKLDDEFERELDRRLEEMERDPTATVPWSEVKKLW